MKKCYKSSALLVREVKSDTGRGAAFTTGKKTVVCVIACLLWDIYGEVFNRICGSYMFYCGGNGRYMELILEKWSEEGYSFSYRETKVDEDGVWR